MPLLHVGSTPEAINAARNAILDILTTEREEQTIREALRVFTKVTQVSNVTVTNSTFNAGGEKDPEVYLNAK